MRSSVRVQQEKMMLRSSDGQYLSDCYMRHCRPFGLTLLAIFASQGLFQRFFDVFDQGLYLSRATLPYEVAVIVANPLVAFAHVLHRYITSTAQPFSNGSIFQRLNNSPTKRTMPRCGVTSLRAVVVFHALGTQNMRAIFDKATVSIA